MQNKWLQTGQVELWGRALYIADTIIIHHLLHLVLAQMIHKDIFELMTISEVEPIKNEPLYSPMGKLSGTWQEMYGNM